MQPIAFALTHHSLAARHPSRHRNFVRIVLLCCRYRCVTRIKLPRQHSLPCSVWHLWQFVLYEKKTPSLTIASLVFFSQSKHLVTQHSLLLLHVFKFRQHTVHRHPCINLFLFILPLLLLFCFFSTPLSSVLTFAPYLPPSSLSLSHHLRKNGSDSCCGELPGAQSQLSLPLPILQSPWHIVKTK